MSTRKFQLHVSGFKGGLNTEASSLNILASELMEGSTNVELLQNGEARRRRGVDFVGASTNGAYLQLLRASTVSAETLYESPSEIYVKLTAPNGETIERLIVDLDDKFYIYKTDKASLSKPDLPFQTISRTWEAFGTTVTKSVADQKFYNMQFEQSGNRVFFTGLKCHPGYMSVGSDNISLELSFIDVLIRDPDLQIPNTRVKKSGGTDWYECIEPHISAAINEPGVGAEFTRFWFRLDGDAPTSPAPDDWVTSTTYISTFLKRYDKYVDAVSSDTHPTAIAFYAGRVWLSGDPKHPADTLFTQVFINDADLEKFHQYADPFDTTDPDLVDDDGGVISIQGTGNIRDMTDIGSALFIGSDHGVWQIKGQDQIFKATSFSSDRVLTEAVLGAGAMVNADNTLFVFGENNIWRADFFNASSGSAIALANFVSFSENRLETFYSDIPASNKQASKPVYNPTDRKIYYFYNSIPRQFTLSYGSKMQPGYFTDLLVMDVRSPTKSVDTTTDQLDQTRTLLGAFYTHSFADTAHTQQPYIAHPFIAPDLGVAENNVVSASGMNNVVSASGVNNVTAVGGTEAGSAVFLLTLQRENPSGDVINVNHAFSTLLSSSLTDWTSDTNFKTSFVSKAITGIQTMGDVLHKKSMTYIFLVFKRVETGVLVANVDTNPGGCFIRTAWQWAANTDSPLYGQQFQVYYPDRWGLSLTTGAENHDHVWWKHRVRGRGNVVQVIFENDGDKDFHLIGWSQQFHGKLD